MLATKGTNTQQSRSKAQAEGAYTKKSSSEFCNFFLAILALVLTGCATPSPTSPRSEAAVNIIQADLPNWWYVRFHLNWPEGEEPRWYPDLLIADRLIGPILDAEHDQIKLWRFHRRAARDAAGRQFSFIFYATPAVAEQVNHRVATSRLVAELEREGLLQQVVYDDPARPRRPGIADTSDPAWSPQIQRAWPYFIMGVSRLWLRLIREYGKSSDLPQGPQARYAAISRALDKQWREEGGHALLHHLNAVFGYRELATPTGDMLRF